MKEREREQALGWISRNGVRGKTELTGALDGGRFWWPGRRWRDVQAEGNRGQSGQCDENTGLQIRRRVRQLGHLGMLLNSRLSSNLNLQAMSNDNEKSLKLGNNEKG